MLRKLLERVSVSTLARQARPDDLTKVQAAVEHQAEYVEDPEQFLALDEEFHLLIAHLAGLERTAEMLAGLRSAMAIIYAGTPAARSLSREVVEEHRKLVAAIADGDPDRAAAFVEEHIEHATRPLLEATRARREQTDALRLTTAR